MAWRRWLWLTWMLWWWTRCSICTLTSFRMDGYYNLAWWLWIKIYSFSTRTIAKQTCTHNFRNHNLSCATIRAFKTCKGKTKCNPFIICCPPILLHGRLPLRSNKLQWYVGANAHILRPQSIGINQKLHRFENIIKLDLRWGSVIKDESRWQSGWRTEIGAERD